MTAIATLGPALMLGTALVLAAVAIFLAVLCMRRRDASGRIPTEAQPLLLGSIACTTLTGVLVVFALLLR